MNATRRAYRQMMYGMMICCLFAAHSADAATLKFPSMIKYEMVRNGSVIGNCMLTKDAKDDKFILRLKDFQGIGVASNDVITTYIFQDGLSLYDIFLERGGNVAYEMRVTKGDTVLGGWVFKFKTLSEIREIEMPAEFPVMNVASSFLIAANVAFSSAPVEHQPYYLIAEGKLLLVNLTHHAIYADKFQGNAAWIGTVNVEYEHDGAALMEFHICKDCDGMTYPIKVKIFENSASIELIANDVAE